MFHLRKRERRATELPQPARPPGRAAGVVQVDGSARTTSSTTRPATSNCPRLEHRLPRYVLTASEAEQVINQANVTQAEGIRDRAILETFYSTGIRRMEMVGPASLRPRSRAGHGRRPAGQRQEGPDDPHWGQGRWHGSKGTWSKSGPGLMVGDSAGDVLFLTARASRSPPNA